MKKIVCPFAKTFTFLNKKWVLLILREMSQKKVERFTALEKNIHGINSRILSQRLKEMETFGLVLKTYHRELPPRVEYSLTPKGKDLLGCFKNIDKWVLKWG